MRRLIILMLAATGLACTAGDKENPMKDIYEIQVDRIDGETISLEQFRGKTLLIVNTASRCGFTGQYEGLQNLFETYADQGLVVLGFPSNDFMKQEPGSNDDIAAFCSLNYGVSFPMFAKVSVKGNQQHSLYAFLTSKQSNPEFGGKISWNFNKFLVSKDGRIINRFGSRTKPDDKKLVNAIEGALK